MMITNVKWISVPADRVETRTRPELVQIAAKHALLSYRDFVTGQPVKMAVTVYIKCDPKNADYATSRIIYNTFNRVEQHFLRGDLGLGSKVVVLNDLVYFDAMPAESE